MAVQRRAAGGGGLTKLKEALASGELGTAYIFHGEESYLREFYLSEMKKQLVAGFESFNYHRMEGKGLTVQALTETVEALPMMAQRTMVQVVDWDLYKLGEEQRTALTALLEDFPPYCCLVIVYDQIEYKPNKTYKKLYAALDK
ncbi:MAG: DNA polymerase III subunit delta, partial [Oscillospiraceae bacterium]|nr:DNA polymerase III subunit delta [Oscillospiraceae bacterium]